MHKKSLFLDKGDLLNDHKSIQIKLFVFPKLVAIQTAVEPEVFYPDLQGFVTGVDLYVGLYEQAQSGYTYTTLHPCTGPRQNTGSYTAVKPWSLDSSFIRTH